MENLVDRIEKIVEEACKKNTNIFGYGIWSHHITQVVKNGLKFTKISDSLKSNRIITTR